MSKSKATKHSIKMSIGAGKITLKGLKQTAWSAITEALVLIVLGLLFVIWPDTMIKLIAYIIGVFFVVKGIYGIIMYYAEQGQNDFFDNRLLSSLVFMLVGIVSLVLGENIAGIFRVVIGIIIIYESLVRINTAMKLSSAGVKNWQYNLAIALLIMAVGIFITFYSGAVVTLIGWLMIAVGIVAIAGDITFIKHVNSVADKFSKIREGEVVKDK